MQKLWDLLQMVIRNSMDPSQHGEPHTSYNASWLDLHFSQKCSAWALSVVEADLVAVPSAAACSVASVCTVQPSRACIKREYAAGTEMGRNVATRLYTVYNVVQHTVAYYLRPLENPAESWRAILPRRSFGLSTQCHHKHAWFHNALLYVWNVANGLLSVQFLLVQLILTHAPTTWRAPDGHVFQHFLLQSKSHNCLSPLLPCP